MTNATTFGEVFREARQRASKTLGEVARYLGVSISFVSDVEHSRRNPFKREQLIAAAGLFGVDPLTLIDAATKERGSMTVAPRDASRLDIVASLARSIDELTPDQLAKIREALGKGRE